MLPDDCSVSYEYYSLSLRDGLDGTASIRQQFQEAADRLNAELPPELSDLGIGYLYISQDRADLDAAVRETVRPTVTTLQAFALVAALATLTITGLIVARQTRRDRKRSAACGPSAPPVARSPAGRPPRPSSPPWPASSPRSGSPTRSPRSDRSAPSAPLDARPRSQPPGRRRAARGRRARRRPGRDHRRRPRPLGVADGPGRWTAQELRAGRASRLVRRGRPPVATGVGAALDTRRAGVGIAAMVGCVVATSAAAAAIVFGASLAELVDEPETYGWPWDVAVITGGGYGDTAMDVVDERLAHPDVRDDIVDHGFYSFDPAIVFGDQPVPVVFGWSGQTAGELPVREGRMPARPGEALVGEDTPNGSTSTSATR